MVYKPQYYPGGRPESEKRKKSEDMEETTSKEELKKRILE